MWDSVAAPRAGAVRAPRQRPVHDPRPRLAGAQSMRAYAEWGRETEMKVQDSAGLARPDEPLSFLQLQARASSVDQVLLGWYRIPKSVDQAVQLARGPFRPHACHGPPLPAQSGAFRA